MKERNLVEVVDGIVDCLYILKGTINSFGLQDLIEEAFDEVHNSNMSKLQDGNVLLREDGKILKGSNYFKPDLKRIIEKFTNKDTIYTNIVNERKVL